MYSPVWKFVVTLKLSNQENEPESDINMVPNLVKFLLSNRKDGFTENITDIDLSKVTIVKQTEQYGHDCESCYCRLTVGDYDCILSDGICGIICTNCLITNNHTLSQIENSCLIGT